MKQHAAPIPRVLRSRRDDRYQAGHPAPPKRAESGYVVSVQDDLDTVTVDILGEELTGVVPLGPMPPRGAICEVESRGDLLCIPLWYEGPVLAVVYTVDDPTAQFFADGPDGPTYHFPTPSVVGTGAVLSDASDTTYWQLGRVRDASQTPRQGFGHIVPAAGGAGVLTYTIRVRTSSSGAAFTSAGVAIALLTKEGPGPDNDDYGGKFFWEVNLGLPLSSGWTTYTGSLAVPSSAYYAAGYPEDTTASMPTPADLNALLAAGELWLLLTPVGNSPSSTGAIEVHIAEFSMTYV